MKPECRDQFFRPLSPTFRAAQTFAAFADFLEHIEDMGTFYTLIFIYGHESYLKFQLRLDSYKKKIRGNLFCYLNPTLLP